MNEELETRLKALTGTLKEVLSEVKSLKEENSYLKTALDQCRQKADLSLKSNKELNRELESMELALAVTGDGAVDKKAKTRITEMVKEIDRCIALLND
jgi:predicted nuclease with TOPRIM domain